ncbi:MAG: thiolase domain-containing protein [Halanaerobium sp.]|nr:thiolase domain-containing protein [Halanaerobium sp.]
MGVNVIGTYHSRVGKLDKSIYELIVEAGKGAIEDAEVAPGDIGGIWVANYGAAGFVNQNHLAPYALAIDEELRFTPCTRVENACASGSAAIKEASNAIKAGEVDYALVIGVEKMTSLDIKGVTRVLAQASYWPEEGAEGMTFPGLFAEYAKGYQKEYGFTDEELATMLTRVAAKNHQNALANPLAHMPMNITHEDILAKTDKENPMIAPPLRLMDCSLVSDGSAAVVLTSSDRVGNKEAVEIAALVHTSDYLPLSRRSNSKFVAGEKAIKKAYELAGIGVEDLDLAEVHDCFTIAEILAYEAMGLAEDGKGWQLLEDGIIEVDGKLPVNPSGGLKAKGHPVGATGVSMAVLATRQLLNNAIGHQVQDARLALTFNIGGSAASNYATIFRRR